MKYMNEKDWIKIWDNKLLSLLDLILRPFFWRNYFKFLEKIKLSTKSDIIELGSGTGKSSLKISKIYGSKVTMVDNCKFILNKSKRYFKENGVKAKFILKDVFEISVKKKYDLVFSDGLIEHFTGSKRKKLFEIHKKLAKKNGYLLIFISHSSLLYWFIRKFLERLGFWKWDETPFSREEVLKLCRKNNLKLIKISNLLFGVWIGVLAQNENLAKK